MNNPDLSKIILETSSHGTWRIDPRDGELLRNLPEHLREEFNKEERYFHQWEEPLVIGESGGKLTELRLQSIKDRMSANNDALFILIIGGNDLGEGKKSLKYDLIVSVPCECRFKEPERQKLSDLKSFYFQNVLLL